MSAVLESISEKFTSLVQEVMPAFEAAAARVGSMSSASVDGMADSVANAADSVGGLHEKLVDVAKPVEELSARMEDQAASGDELARSWKDSVSGALDRGGKFFARLGGVVFGTTEKIRGGMDRVRGVVGKLNDILRVNRLAGFIGSISGNVLRNLGDGLERLGSEGVNLSSSLESTMVSNAKSARQTAFNLGLVGEELSQVTSQASGMARSLEIGAGEAATAIVGFRSAVEELGAVGITSAEDLAKLSDVTGVNSQQFAQLLKHLAKLGVSKKDLGGLVSGFIDMGQRTHDVAGAMGQLPELLELLHTKSALGLDASQLVDFAKQTAQLAGALGRFDIAATEARSVAAGLAQSQTEAQKSFEALFAGIGHDLPGLTTSMNRAGFGIEKAFSLINTGPAGFVEAMGQMVDAARASGKDTEVFWRMLQHQMGAAGVAGADVLISFLRKADKSSRGLLQVSERTTKSMASVVTQGWASARTAADNFEMAQEEMLARFRGLTGSTAGFVQDFRKQSDKLMDSLEALVKKGGPMGTFVGMLADIQKLGVAGILPKDLQASGVLLANVLERLKPLLIMLGSSLAFFPGLTVALGPVVAILGLFSIKLFDAVLNLKDGEEWTVAFGRAWEDTGKILANAWHKAAKFFDKLVDVVQHFLEGLAQEAGNFDWRAFFTSLFRGIGRGIRAAYGAVRDAVGRIFGVFSNEMRDQAPSRGEQILSSIVSIFVSVFDGLVGAIRDVDWAAAGREVLGLILGVQKKISETIRSVDWSGVGYDVINAVLTVFEVLSGPEAEAFLKSFAHALVSRVEVMANAGLDLLDGMLTRLASADLARYAVGIVDNIAKALMEAANGLLPVLRSFIDRLPALLGKAVDVVIDVVKNLPHHIGEFLKGLGPQLRTFLANAIPLLYKAAVAALEFVFIELPPKIWAAIPGILSGLGDLLVGIFDFLANIIIGAFEGIFGGLKETFVGGFNAISEWFTGAWDGLFGPDGWAVREWDKMIDVLSGAWKGLKKATKAAMAWVKDIVKKAVDGLLSTWRGFKNFLGSIWSGLTRGWQTVQETWDKAVSYFEHLFDNLWTKMSTPFNEILKGITDIWDDGAGGGIKGAWDKAVAFFDKLAGKIKTIFTGALDAVAESLKGVWGFLGKMIKDISDILDRVLGAQKQLGNTPTGVQQGAEFLAPDKYGRMYSASGNGRFKIDTSRDYPDPPPDSEAERQQNGNNSSNNNFNNSSSGLGLLLDTLEKPDWYTNRVDGLAAKVDYQTKVLEQGLGRIAQAVSDLAAMQRPVMAGAVTRSLAVSRNLPNPNLGPRGLQGGLGVPAR